MTNPRDRKWVRKPRIEITNQNLRRLFEIRKTMSVPELSKRSELPYMLVYNIVHRRVKTISDRHYRALFGQAPQPQEPQKVDGADFRAMADLWLFLNQEVSKSAC